MYNSSRYKEIPFRFLTFHIYIYIILCFLFLITETEGEFPEDQYPDFFGWVERMKATDAVKRSYQPPEAHAAFIKSVKAGPHDYGHADTTGQGITIYAKKE